MSPTCHQLFTNFSPICHQLLTNFINFSPNSPTFSPTFCQLFINISPTSHQVFTKFTNFSPNFHQIQKFFYKLFTNFTNFTNFSPTSPTFHQLDQLDLTTNNQLRNRLNLIGSASAMPAKIERKYWITTTGDYEPNNCHQSSIWGCLKMRCPFFSFKVHIIQFFGLFSNQPRFSPWKLVVWPQSFSETCTGNKKWENAMARHAGPSYFPASFFPISMTN